MKFLRGKKNTTLSDRELIEKYKDSLNSFYAGQLFQRYTQLISVIAYKYLKNSVEAEDAIMEVFEIILRDLKNHEVNNFKTWVYSVTKHHCLKKTRKENNRIILNVEEAFHNIPAEEFSVDKYKIEKQLDQLKSAISNLGTEQKKCIELFYLQEKSYKEVSDLTGYSMKEVKSFLQNGKRNLKNYLETAK